MNKQERLVWQKEYRKSTNYSGTKKYEKTEKGFLMRLYRNMKSRILGIQKVKYHLYQGKTLIDKDEFYEWALSSEEFKILFNEYRDSNFDMKMAPSVDRIDSTRGYEIDNMEWVTHSENSKRGALSRHNKGL